MPVWYSRIFKERVRKVAKPPSPLYILSQILGDLSRSFLIRQQIICADCQQNNDYAVNACHNCYSCQPIFCTIVHVSSYIKVFVKHYFHSLHVNCQNTLIGFKVRVFCIVLRSHPHALAFRCFGLRCHEVCQD